MEQLVIFLAEYFYLLVIAVAVIVALLLYRKHLVALAVAAICIGGGAYVIAKLLNRVILDPRPFIVTGQPALIPSSTDNGFPSDHTLLIAAVAAVISTINYRLGIIFWLLALVVGLARVAAGVHHLLDILGSIVIVAVVYGVYLLGRRLWVQRQVAVRE